MDDKSKQNDFNMKLSDSFIDQERNNYPAKAAATTCSSALQGELKDTVQPTILSSHASGLNLPFITLNLPNATCETYPRDTWFLLTTTRVLPTLTLL